MHIAPILTYTAWGALIAEYQLSNWLEAVQNIAYPNHGHRSWFVRETRYYDNPPDPKLSNNS